MLKRGALKIMFFDFIPRRLLEAIGFIYIVWSSLSADTSSLKGYENKVRASLSVKVLGSLMG